MENEIKMVLKEIPRSELQRAYDKYKASLKDKEIPESKLPETNCKVPMPKVKPPKKEEHKYINMAKEIGELVTEKQKAYGDSFGQSKKILEILYPDGVQPEQYQDLLTITRIIDKLFRIATDKDALGESPYKDIMGYALVSVVKEENDNKNKLAEIYDCSGEVVATVRTSPKINCNSSGKDIKSCEYCSVELTTENNCYNLYGSKQCIRNNKSI